jgi:hypothetical protein
VTAGEVVGPRRHCSRCTYLEEAQGLPVRGLGLAEGQRRRRPLGLHLPFSGHRTSSPTASCAARRVACMGGVLPERGGRTEDANMCWTTEIRAV